MAAAEGGPGRIRALTVAMSVPCDHCSTPIPVNGPTRSVHCAACQRDTKLSRVAAELAVASEGAHFLGSPYSVRSSREAAPECLKCEKPVPIADYIGREGLAREIFCPACGAGLPCFPAPAWLREQVPTILEVFGADPEIARTEGGLAIEVKQESPRPIVMACPSCAGGLTVTDKTDRVMTCQYCSSSVFVPDELWRRMHPVKTMRSWTVTYTGRKLVTAEELAEKAKQEAERRREAERAREEAERQAAARAQAEAATRRFRRGVAIVLGALAILVGAIVALKLAL